MKFLENGPVIPDLLLERRDAGRVVFFCGAGVSLNAGMPTFRALTEHVVDLFDPPEDSNIMKAFSSHLNNNEGAVTPLDQIFNLLQREYGREEVNKLVTERLSKPAATSSAPAEHNLIFRISKDRCDKPQIVTTNFDLLFERGGMVYDRINVPPYLPDLSLGMPITGITYLHGKLPDETGYHHPYVLSSADFGRAYLAEGWATNFVRSLLSKYTVVLVGYQAEDPPLRYLLEGLNHDGGSDRSNLYAFDKGIFEDIETKWRDRGVTPIAYSNHKVLWETMKAWADRADDPRRWRQDVICFTREDPKTLRPYQRGQVAHLIRTTPGARQFSNAKFEPHPEWICVFDTGTRAAAPGNGYGEEAGTFDPLDLYGLDDDPPLVEEGAPQTRHAHDNLLEWNKGDENPSTAHRIGGRQVEGFADIPSRLRHLIDWIGRNLNSPAMAWWAARQNGLHPELIATLKRSLLNEPRLHPKARQTWDLILEHQTDHRPALDDDDSMLDFQTRIVTEGWTYSVLRDFAETAAVKVECSIPKDMGKSRPPSGTWDDVELSQITRLRIGLPSQHREDIDVPDNVLEQIVMLLQLNIWQTSKILVELSEIQPDLCAGCFQMPTCYPDQEMERIRDYNFDRNIRWLVDLFKRLAVYNPNSATAIASTWSLDDPYFFRNLKLFALNYDTLFDINQTYTSIKALDDDAFWNEDSVRELLFLLKDRWSEFTTAQRLEITNRILNGPPKHDHVSSKKYPEFRDDLAARYGRYLTLHGCVLSHEMSDKLDAIIASFSEWNDNRAADIITLGSGNIRLAEIEDNLEDFLNLPVDKIIEQASEISRQDIDCLKGRRLFTELVTVNPRKALSALTVAAKRDDCQTKFWAILIRDWPEGTSDRLFMVFMHRLAGLRRVVVRELSSTLGDWLRKSLPALLARDKSLAWCVFDHCISTWIYGKRTSTKSRSSEVTDASRQTFHDAIRSPVGGAAVGVIQSINELNLGQVEGIPSEFKLRLERLLTAPGEGSDHCVAVLANDLCRLHHIDPDWAAQHLLPLFAWDYHTAGPAWNGLLRSGKLPSSGIMIVLKKYIIDLFPRIYGYGWNRDVAEVGARWLVWLALFRCNKPGGLSVKEARSCLRKMNDSTRRGVIFWLREVGVKNEDGWKTLIIPFLNTAWPREKSIRTSASVADWISMLDGAGNDFPAAYEAVKGFLVPIEGRNCPLYRFIGDIGGQTCLASRYPEKVLDLMHTVTPAVSDAPPYKLARILELIKEADYTLATDPRYNRLLDLVERV